MTDNQDIKSVGVLLGLDEPTARACQAAYRKAPPWLAERTILLIRAGSHANGVSLPTSDIDLRGAAIAPRESYFGFLHRFEGFECKEPDCAIPDIRFFMRAASEGELNALQVLFCDERDLLVCQLAGMTLRQMRNAFLSKRVVKPFAGFARGQIEKVRRRLEAFPNQVLDDLAKSAMHAERIVRMLYEILIKGEVRVRRPDADWLVAIRQIKHRDRLLSVVADTERELARLPEWVAASPLPDRPDYERLNRLCVDLASRVESAGAT